MKNSKNHFCGIIVLFALTGSVVLGATYGGGSGTTEDPYQIATKAHLLELSTTTTDYGSCFILTADIDLVGETFTTAVIAPDTDAATNGFQGTQFTGVFDGNGHIVSNLKITATTIYYIGMFGYIASGGQVSNLGLKNVNITGYSYVGGLCGYNYYGTISQCYATGTVTGRYDVGGLCGYNYHGILTSSYVTGTVTGSVDVGGLCGYNYYGGMISQCYAIGTVSGIATRYYIGGLCGENFDGTVTQSYATGTVTGDNGVGGLCGKNYIGTVTQSYATGTVTGNSGVGGLCGYNAGYIDSDPYMGYENYVYTYIINCYSTGNVTGQSDTGGLVGGAYLSEVENSFWNSQTSGQTTSDGGTSKTTTEMKLRSTFTSAGWDFIGETVNGTVDIWTMRCEGMNYPKLTWQQVPTGDFVCPDGVNTEDLDYFVGQWLMNNCTSANDYCNGVDTNTSGTVDIVDFAVLAQNWLEQ